MIFLKTFSIQGLRKGPFIRILFLVMVIMLVLIPLFSSGDEVVFSHRKDTIILVLVPSETSRIVLEGKGFREQGRVQEHTPFIHEVPSNGDIHITMYPQHGLVLEKHLCFEKGRLLASQDEDYWEWMLINEWPHQVYEVQLYPSMPLRMEMEEEILIHEEKVNLNGVHGPEVLQLIRQGDRYFLEVDGTRLALKGRGSMDFQWEIGDINHDGNREIVIQGGLGGKHKYVEIYGYWEDGIKRIFWEHGESITLHDNGRIQVEKRLMDTVEHYRTITYGWEAGEYIEESGVINYWQGKPKWPQTPENTIRAFFEAIEIDLFEEARGYISEEYRGDVHVKKMMGVVEEGWRSIARPAYYFHGGYGQGDIHYMAFYYDTDIHGRYSRIRIYGFEGGYESSSQGPWKIKSIVEVE